MPRQFFIGTIAENSKMPYCLLERKKDGSWFSPVRDNFEGVQSVTKVAEDLVRIARSESKKLKTDDILSVFTVEPVLSSFLIADNKRGFIVIKSVSDSVMKGFFRAFGTAVKKPLL